MELPLVFDLLVARLRLRVGNDEGGDLPEREDGSRGLLGRLPGYDGVGARLDHAPGVGGSLAGFFEADVRIRAEAHIPPNAVHLVTQEPRLLPTWTDDEHEAVAIDVPSLLCAFDATFGQFAHVSPTLSPTLCLRLRRTG